MKILVFIISLLYLLVGIWVTVFELPKIIFLAQRFEANLPLITYIYPFIFLTVGILGIMKVKTEKLAGVSTKAVLLIQIAFPVLLFLIGRIIY